ncbi:MAG: 16S rRNA (adenine(1518)-N(6)/adenine(1519)-N(6))-dimethyltransferase RsmA [Candidatus Thermoplasmatota archaeon]
MRRVRFSQHFLVDEGVARREVAYADVNSEDVVLEIGPGRGVLTRIIARYAKQVIAVEIDNSFIDYLKRSLPDNVTVINADVLSIDLSTLPVFSKVVANLPFEISSPVTSLLLEQRFKKAVLMYQKDFAERMVAKPGGKDYSSLSINVYYHAGCRMLEVVSRYCFSPVPRVDASLVEIIPREKPPFYVKDEVFFFDMVKRLFMHRRKKIRYVIRGYYLRDTGDLPYMDKRVEELAPEQIADLSNMIYDLLR